MDQQNLENVIKEVLANMMRQGALPAGGVGTGGSTTSPAGSAGGTGTSGGGTGARVTFRDYPLGEKSADKLRTPTGKRLDEITLEAVLRGDIGGADVRITAETLEMQAQVAESMGRNSFAANLRRAAELISVPDERLLQMYNALRPYHSTKQELLAIADELSGKYNAQITARHVREAAEVGEARGRLKKA